VYSTVRERQSVARVHLRQLVLCGVTMNKAHGRTAGYINDKDHQMIFPGDCFELPQVLEHVNLVTEKAVFIPGIFLGGGGGQIPPPKKKTQSPRRLPNCVQSLTGQFFPSLCKRLVTSITETFFLWTINTGNYSTLGNQKGANLCLKIYQNTFGGRAPPGPAGGGLMRPQTL